MLLYYLLCYAVLYVVVYRLGAPNPWVGWGPEGYCAVDTMLCHEDT